MDTFQLKGLRRIFGVPTTYVDRRYTNEYLFARATAEIQHEKPAAKPIQAMSEYHRARRVYLLARLITLGKGDPSATATMDVETFQAHSWGVRRVGAPRKQWLQTTLQDMWEEARRLQGGTLEELDVNKQEHRDLLKAHAAELDRKHKWSSKSGSVQVNTSAARVEARQERVDTPAPVGLPAQAGTLSYRFEQGGDHFMTTG